MTKVFSNFDIQHAQLLNARVHNYNNISSLPMLSTGECGEMAFVLEDKCFYGWDGTRWNTIGSQSGSSVFRVTSDYESNDNHNDIFTLSNISSNFSEIKSAFDRGESIELVINGFPNVLNNGDTDGDLLISDYFVIDGGIIFVVLIGEYSIKVTIHEGGGIGNINKIEGSTSELMVNVTYNELVNMINNSALVPGMKYKITDYECKLEENGNVIAVNNHVDIIVMAISETEICADAKGVTTMNLCDFDAETEGSSISCTLCNEGETEIIGVEYYVWEVVMDDNLNKIYTRTIDFDSLSEMFIMQDGHLYPLSDVMRISTYRLNHYTMENNDIELKYSVFKEYFEWASDDCKGVIYYAKDGFNGNSAPFDFFNIKIKRYLTYENGIVSSSILVSPNSKRPPYLSKSNDKLFFYAINPYNCHNVNVKKEGKKYYSLPDIVVCASRDIDINASYVISVAGSYGCVFNECSNISVRNASGNTFSNCEDMYITYKGYGRNNTFTQCHYIDVDRLDFDCCDIKVNTHFLIMDGVPNLSNIMSINDSDVYKSYIDPSTLSYQVIPINNISKVHLVGDVNGWDTSNFDYVFDNHADGTSTLDLYNYKMAASYNSKFKIVLGNEWSHNLGSNGDSSLSYDTEKSLTGGGNNITFIDESTFERANEIVIDWKDPTIRIR